MIYEIGDDFIASFEEVIPDNLCDRYIEYFDNWMKNYGVGVRKSLQVEDSAIDAMTYRFYNDSLRMEHLNAPFINQFMSNVWPVYCERFQALSGSSKIIFDMKVQKTVPGQGYHIWHCENNLITERNRVCAFMMYLNDVEEGGETEFLYQKKRIKPKKGKVLIWPAQFTHMHRGNPPLSGEKYIITGWVEYA